MSISVNNRDFIDWLRERQWLAQSGYWPRYHAVFADPPYFLGSINKRFGGSKSKAAKPGRDGAFGRATRGFLGKDWDGFKSVYHYQAWVTEWGTLLLDFVYPGAIGAFFGGTRTWHRLAAGLEDAGWEIFDTLIYWYGTGLAKDPDIGHGRRRGLKPAFEPVILARAPRQGHTFHYLLNTFGTGSLNIDGCRIQVTDRQLASKYRSVLNAAPRNNRVYGEDKRPRHKGRTEPHPAGRYPSNTLLTCACKYAYHEPTCPVALLEAIKTSGESASRFYYTAKAASWEKSAGLDQRNEHPTIKSINLNEYVARLLLPPESIGERRLLNPFMGTGSEAIGAHLAEWEVIDGIEKNSAYADIAKQRVSWWAAFTNYEQASALAESGQMGLL